MPTCMDLLYLSKRLGSTRVKVLFWIFTDPFIRSRASRSPNIGYSRRLKFRSLEAWFPLHFLRIPTPLLFFLLFSLPSEGRISSKCWFPIHSVERPPLKLLSPFPICTIAHLPYDFFSTAGCCVLCPTFLQVRPYFQDSPPWSPSHWGVRWAVEHTFGMQIASSCIDHWHS